MKNNAQKTHYNPKSYVSPVIPSYDMVNLVDENGDSKISWKEVNGDDLIRSHGTCNMWSLDNLMKAGIDPSSLKVRTGYNSRIEGFDDLNIVTAEVEKIINEKNE